VNIFSALYTEILYRPLFNALVFFYTNLPWQDLGIAIIVLTICIRILLTPLLWKGQKAQKELALIQPELKKIQEQFKDDREKQGRAIMDLYAKRRVNPFSGCLIALVQLPVLIALFGVFRHVADPAQLAYLYSAVSNPGALDPISFSLIDLSKGGIQGLGLGFVAAVSQYFQTKMTLPSLPTATGAKNDFSRMLQVQSTYVFPLIIFAWSYTLPAALALYWTILNILGILQEIIMRRIKDHESRITG